MVGKEARMAASKNWFLRAWHGMAWHGMAWHSMAWHCWSTWSSCQDGTAVWPPYGKTSSNYPGMEFHTVASKVRLCGTTVLPTRHRSQRVKPTILYEHILHATCGPTHTCACRVIRGLGDRPVSIRSRRSIQPFMLFGAPTTTPGRHTTQHNTHDRCMVAFQCSCTCVHMRGTIVDQFGSYL